MNDARQESRWPLGCQARPWLQTLGPEAFGEQLPAIMRTIADAGFSGFETALAALPLDSPPTFAAWQEAAEGLSLAGAHTGGAWWDPDKAAAVPELIETVAALPALGCDRLIVSIGAGVRELDDHDLAKMVSTLRTLGEGTRQRGVVVAIHNHDHELAADARVIRALIDGSPGGEFGLGADLGWVANGGWDPITFLREFGERVTYLHVRDVIRQGDRDGFIEVGKGTMDWPGIVDALRDFGFDGWLVAESEFSDAWFGFTDPGETAAAQLAGMRRVLGSDVVPDNR